MHNHRDELDKLDEHLDVRPSPGLVDASLSVGFHLHIDHYMSVSTIAKFTTPADLVAAHDAEHAKGKIDHIHD